MSKPLTIEIHGTGTHNRGAELMAIAVAARIRQIDPSIRLAVPPRFGSYEDRARHGFWLSNGFGRRSPWRYLLPFSNRWVSEVLGLIQRNEINAVFDASGFAFSDQWGPRLAWALQREMNSRCRMKQKLVLLPQAYGPFQQPQVIAAAKLLFQRAQLIFARDVASFKAVEALGFRANLHTAPDFTIPLRGWVPAEIDLPERFAAVVPNMRMLDKTGDRAGVLYLRVLQQVLTGFHNMGLMGLAVLHDATEDQHVLAGLRSTVPELRVVSHRDPTALKGILGRAQIVFASRYHALVSAMSQGVPCIAAGWSHKYDGLFQDFGCPQYLVRDLASPEVMGSALSSLACESARRRMSEDLVKRSKSLELKLEHMWTEVEQLLGSEGCQKPNSD